MKGKKSLRVIQIILCLAFLFFGIGKFAVSPEQGAQTFGQIGGATSQYFTGAFEILSAVLVVVPSLSFVGAIMIAITMVVALVLHFTILGLDSLALIAFIFLILSIYVAVKSRKEFLKRK